MSVVETGYRPGMPFAGDRYILGEVIGRGGHAVVHRAIRRDHEPVALKIVTTPDLNQLAEHEASIHEHLRHPNVLSYHQAGIDEQGRLYLELDLAKKSLASILKEDGPPEVAVAVPMLVNVANGLDYIHDQGIIHRDIKPANLLVMNDQNQVVVADFGVAMRMPHDPFFDDNNENYGSAPHAAPERVKDPPESTTASDVYSLSVVAYETFTGQLPFVGKTSNDFAIAHRSATPPPFEEMIGNGMMSSTLAALEIHVQQGLAKDPSQRPRAGDFGESLIVAFNQAQVDQARERTVIDVGRSRLSILRRRSSRTQPLDPISQVS